ncbi:MAG: tripartite tricarboxylate transporter substrate binding protein, partial [Comamonadaceae bacterium]
TKGFEADQWYGLVAPAGTRPDIVRLLNDHVNKALALPEVAARLAGEGAEPTPTTPQAYAALIASELKRWAPVIKAGGIKPE